MKDSLHYVACGLPNVWLENGYDILETTKGKAFKIHNMEELHDAICMALAEKDELLTGDEIRFLRTELSMSRKMLGLSLGCSPETIKKWEAGENTISKSADIVLRALSREYRNESGKVRALVDAINNLEKATSQKKELKFKEASGAWMQDCA